MSATGSEDCQQIKMHPPKCPGTREAAQRRQRKKGVIYEVPCKDCQCVYIGETGRTLDKRLSEHKNAVEKNDTKNGNTVHSWTKQHQVDCEAAKTIEVEGRKLLEEASIGSHAHPPTTANIQLGLWVDHQSLLAACTEPTLAPLISLHSPHYNTPVTTTDLINYHFLISQHPYTLTASDTHFFIFN